MTETARQCHNRFNRKVYAHRKDFTAALAKWLVQLSPYTVPDNLSVCIEKFSVAIEGHFRFDELGYVHTHLIGMTQGINTLLEEIPEIMSLNERKNGREGMQFVDRHSTKPDPDNDFIDIMALAQNITCSFAEEADAQCWLDQNR